MPRNLRIGINALYLIPGGVGGTEIYLRNLLAALARIDRRNHYFVYLNRETDAELCPKAANFAPVETGVRASFRAGRLLWEQLRLPLEARKAKLDVLFCPGFTSPSIGRSRRVTVIHDMQHKRQPENFGAIERRAWGFFVGQSIKRSHLLVTVSDNSKADILSSCPIPPDRVRVVRHGVEEAFFGLADNETYDKSLLAEAGLPECRYLLAVSTVHPHKNWGRLLDAFEKVRERDSTLHLAVCGLAGKSWDEVKQRIEGGALSGYVHLLGWQPRNRLIGLFRFAEALVFPSTFEGFGIPVAEALAAELPVACSDIPPLREIADGCATFFDAESAESMSEAICSVLGDKPRRELQKQAGRERAADLSWTRAAEQTLAIFLEAARE